MSETGGYRGYKKGGNGKWFLLAGIVLLLIVFLVVQRFVVFQSGGGWRIELPQSAVSDTPAES